MRVWKRISCVSVFGGATRCGHGHNIFVITAINRRCLRTHLQDIGAAVTFAPWPMGEVLLCSPGEVQAVSRRLLRYAA